MPLYPLLADGFHFLKQQINKSSVAPWDLGSQVQAPQPGTRGLHLHTATVGLHILHTHTRFLRPLTCLVQPLGPSFSPLLGPSSAFSELLQQVLSVSLIRP